MNAEQRVALLAAAREAAGNARARHSGFRVGAAVLDDQGRIHAGCNVESDSYGLTICAERAAIFAALAAGAEQLVAVAVSATGQPLSAARMPCGACRQVMVEYLAPNAAVLVDGVAEFSPPDLLPEAFRLQ
jgi:cytidine deaminase